MIARVVFTMVLMFLIDYYAFQALRTVAQQWSDMVRSAAYVLFWSVPSLFVAFLVVTSVVDTSGWDRSIMSYFRIFMFIAYFSKLFMSFPMIIDDVRRLVLWGYRAVTQEHVHRPDRSNFLAKTGLFLGLLPLATMTYGIVRNKYRYQVYTKKLKIKGLPANLQGLRIAQISDIHSGTFTAKEPVRHAIDIINEANADLVFFTGDLVNDRATEMTNFMDVFDKIRSKYGVFSILGNHDYGDYHRWDSPEDKAANLASLKDIHAKLGWKLLLNEHQMLDIADEKVAVIGVENYSALPQFQKYGDIDKAAAGTEEAALRLLLSHDPTHWDSKVRPNHPNIQVTFSGHTHGFQFGIEIPGFFRWSPSQYIFKQWAGLYQNGEQYLYVNRGLGMLGYPGRIGILPEITVIELTA